MTHAGKNLMLLCPDTVSYRKQNTIHDTEPVSLSVSPSRIFFIVPNLGSYRLKKRQMPNVVNSLNLSPPSKNFARIAECLLNTPALAPLFAATACWDCGVVARDRAMIYYGPSFVVRPLCSLARSLLDGNSLAATLGRWTRVKRDLGRGSSAEKYTAEMR